MRFIVLLLFIIFSIPSFSQEANKTVMIMISNCALGETLRPGISKNPDAFIHTFIIHTFSDGVISDISLTTSNYIIDPHSVYIKRIANRIELTDSRSKINDLIYFDNNIITASGPSFSCSGISELIIKSNPQNNIIYDNQLLSLKYIPNSQLIEIYKNTPCKYYACSYSNNILLVDYLYAGNVNFKYAYHKDKHKTLVTYFYPAGNDFIKFSPAIVIKGDSIHVQNNIIDIINYFILQSVNDILAEILFPIIFLPAWQ